MWIVVQQRRFFDPDFTDFVALFSVEKGHLSTPVVDILWRRIGMPLPIGAVARGLLAKWNPRTDFLQTRASMRPTWSGTLVFGLVAIPVSMHSAVRSKERISFRMLHKADLSPIKYDRVCEAEGESVPWNEIVKGYEYTKGKYIVLTDEDFKA